KNSGAQAQRLVGSVDPVDGATEVLITGPDKRQVKFVPLVEADHDEGIFVELAAGDSLGAVVPVFFGANGWTFASPGRYELVAAYHSPGGKGEMKAVKSATLSIEIKASADGSGEFLIGKKDPVSYEAGKFLVWQAGDHLVRGREHLEILISRWQGSPIADYVHSAFARSYGNRFMDYRKRQVRPPDCGKAMEHLGRASDDRLPHYLRLQNGLTRMRCALREGKKESAQAEITKARELAANRPEFRGILRRFDELGRNGDGQTAPKN
ncbi:MAG: hypothetical protein L0Z53_28075, partial [Acidobacteriales bacterium]|nr:hypothetical protein [Terriglobales bacterium]